MFSGKMKAVTFSYDDGVTQDIRLVEILNRYNLKATFNLNSELLGKDGSLDILGKRILRNKVQPHEITEIYKGHEIAAHTLTHPDMTEMPADEVIRQVEQDRLNLSELSGTEVIGMAYPGRQPNYNSRIARIIKNGTGVKYARTTICNKDFSYQNDLYEFHPSVFHRDWDQLYKLAEKFVELDPKSEKIFYIWGHSYEFDINDEWDKFEEFCKYIANRSDIFYGTNKEILL